MSRISVRVIQLISKSPIGKELKTTDKARSA